MSDLQRDYSRFVVSKKPVYFNRFTIHSLDDHSFVLVSDPNRRKLQELLRLWKREQVERAENAIKAAKKAKRQLAAKKAAETRRRNAERKLAA